MLHEKSKSVKRATHTDLYQYTKTVAHRLLVELCGRVDALVFRVITAIAASYDIQPNELSVTMELLDTKLESEDFQAISAIYHIWTSLKHELYFDERVIRRFPTIYTTIYDLAVERLSAKNAEVLAMHEMVRLLHGVWPLVLPSIQEVLAVDYVEKEIREASIPYKEFVAEGTLAYLHDHGWRDELRGQFICFLGSSLRGKLAIFCTWNGTVAHVKLLPNHILDTHQAGERIVVRNDSVVGIPVTKGTVAALKRIESSRETPKIGMVTTAAVKQVTPNPFKFGKSYSAVVAAQK